jgi:hypothetical protein
VIEAPGYNSAVNQRLRFLIERLARLPGAWWAVVLTLPALVPLLRGGFFASDDGLIHVYRLAALDEAVRAGVLYPRWFPEFAFGYGHPVLNFYGPLSYYAGLPFTLLGLDPALAIKLVMAAGLLASAAGMWLFARQHLSTGAAVVAAVVYVYLPYHLADLYVRGAVAELLAFAWLPFILWAAHHAVTRPGGAGWRWATLAGLLLAALVLTHSLSTLLFAPVLIGYILLLVWRPGDERRGALARVALAVVLAVAASAFHWLPILAESEYVGLGHGASQGYRDHLLPLAKLVSFDVAYRYRGAPGVPITYPLGWLQALLLAGGLWLLVGPGDEWSRDRLSRRVAIFFLMAGLVSALMLTRTALPAWAALERVLALLQYPWRIEMITALATAFVAGALYARLRVRVGPAAVVAVALLLVVTGAWALWRLPYVPVEPDLSVEAMWQADRDTGQVGATWTGEYLPVWVTEQRWALSLPSAPEAAALPEAGQAVDPSQAGATLRLDGASYTGYDLEVDAPRGTTLVLHQFHFPGWQAQWQGGTIASRPAGSLGLAAFDLPPGRGPLALHLALTPAQRWGSLLSLASLLAAGLALVIQAQLQGTGRVWRTWLLAAACILAACGLIGHLALPNGYVRAVQPAAAVLENTAELLAFSTDRPAYRPGDSVEVTLYWRALSSPGQNLKAFLHLTDAALTGQPAQHDGDPGGGFTPTTRWLPGELVPDTHRLILPVDLPPGRYVLWAGLYEFETLRNLAVAGEGRPAGGERVYLGEIEVKGSRGSAPAAVMPAPSRHPPPSAESERSASCVIARRPR